jgi:hypothetical protein
MTTRVFAIGAVTLALAACATTAPAPAGMEAGKFVSFDCEGQDFQARYSVDTGTVRSCRAPATTRFPARASS